MKQKKVIKVFLQQKIWRFLRSLEYLSSNAKKNSCQLWRCQSGFTLPELTKFFRTLATGAIWGKIVIAVRSLRIYVLGF